MACYYGASGVERSGRRYDALHFAGRAELASYLGMKRLSWPGEEGKVMEVEKQAPCATKTQPCASASAPQGRVGMAWQAASQFQLSPCAVRLCLFVSLAGSVEDGAQSLQYLPRHACPVRINNAETTDGDERRSKKK